MLTIVHPDDLAVLEARVEDAASCIRAIRGDRTVEGLAAKAERRRAKMTATEQATADAIVAEHAATVQLIAGTLGDLLAVLEPLVPRMAEVRAALDPVEARYLAAQPAEGRSHTDAEDIYDGITEALGLGTLYRLAEEVEVRLSAVLRGWVVSRGRA